MNEFFIRLAISAVVFGLAALIFLWRYHAVLGLPAKRRTFQYRLFALRDRVIDLIVDGVMKEDDPKWQALYSALNASAKPVVVDRMRSGLPFVLEILRKAAPPTPGELASFDSLPQPVKQIYADYVNAVLSICWEGSFLLRLAVWLAKKAVFVARWLQRQRPVETATYRSFERAKEQLCPA